MPPSASFRRPYRLAAKLTLWLCTPLTIGWLWLWTVSLPLEAARYGLAIWFITEPEQSELKAYAHLFPQTVADGTLTSSFTHDFPSVNDPFPILLHSEGVSVINYFYVVKQVLDYHYHLKSGAYPEPGHLSPLTDTLSYHRWPQLESAHCRYIRLNKDNILLGWAGPDGKFEDPMPVVRHMPKPYGLIRIGDDWWVRCEYFGLAPKIEDVRHRTWPLVRRALKAEGIEIERMVEQFYTHRSGVVVEWRKLFLNPITLLLIGTLLISGFTLWKMKDE